MTGDTRIPNEGSLKLWTIALRVLFALSTLLAGLVLLIGLSLVIGGVRTEIQDIVYFRFPYLLFGLKCIGVGLVAVLLEIFPEPDLRLRLGALDDNNVRHAMRGKACGCC